MSKKTGMMYDAMQIVSTLSGDSLKSLFTGQGTKGGKDKVESLCFADRILTDQEAAIAFANNWIARKIVLIPVQDATRKGRTWHGDKASVIRETGRALNYNNAIFTALWQSRLFGDAAIYMGIKGQDPSEPLELEKIKKNNLEHLTVFPGYELQAEGELNFDVLSGGYQEPEYFSIVGAAGSSATKIHRSRFALFKGGVRPFQQQHAGVATGMTASSSERPWGGDSVLKSVYDTILHSGGAFAGVAHLMLEANVDVYGIPGLMECIKDEGWQAKLLARLGLANRGKGNYGALIMDANETFHRRSASFANVDNVMEAFQLACAAAADIPGTRFLGRTPAGLSSTGESDLANYYDMVSSIQEVGIEPVIYNIDQAMLRHTFGTQDTSEFTFEWNPLRQQTDKEKAETALARARAVKELGQSDIVPIEAAYKRMDEWGFFDGTGISDFASYAAAIRVNNENRGLE